MVGRCNPHGFGILEQESVNAMPGFQLHFVIHGSHLLIHEYLGIVVFGAIFMA